MIMKAWVKKFRIPFCITINEFPKWDSPAFLIHHETFSTHHCVHFSEIYDTQLEECSQSLLVFTVNTISLWPSVLDADIKCSLVGQLLIALWGKWYHSTFF
jgi:hypothetical protein